MITLDIARQRLLNQQMARPTFRAPRVHAANAHMYRKLGLDGGIFKLSHAALRKALQSGRQLTRNELRPALQKAGI